jgi:GTP 3',8-cyclase
MNDVDFPVGARCSRHRRGGRGRARPVKVNMVVKRGVNERQHPADGRHFRGTGHIVRFIEFMDVGTPTAGAWTTSCRAARSSRDRSPPWPLEPVDPHYRGEVAERWRYRDGAGEIGIIASVTPAVLRRLHARAPLRRRPALHLPVRRRGHDLRALLRGGASISVWGSRPR